MSCARYCFVFFSAAIFFNAPAQTSPDTLKHFLDDYSVRFPGEKLYIHLDKPYYSPGDTLWFKVYLTDAAAHLPDSVSQIIYVDLMRKSDGTLVRHQVLMNEGGFARGGFQLSDSLIAGRYEIVGFTNWMRNFPDDLFFRKDIMIYTLADIKERDEKDIDRYFTVADLQFFPEGGNLIAGVQNRVAFKALNQYGKGVDFKAFVISDNKDTVAAISSQHLGMGSFVIKPKAAGKYIAVVEKSGTAEFRLPDVTTSGYTLIVDNLSNKDLIKVTARNNFPYKDRPILIGHQRGNVVFALQSNAEGNSFAWTLPKEDVPDNGIVQLTLFNEKGVPQCERLIYHENRPPLQISITTDKASYAPREKVDLNINVKDQDDHPVSANFSLAVTDSMQVIPEVNGGNIYNYMYLASDIKELVHTGLKGSIEQPAYYFNRSNSNALVHLDILLMTQGWRRFSWKDVVEHKNTILPFEIEQGINVKGKVVLGSGKIPPKPVSISLFYSQGVEYPKYLNVLTDPAGKFVFRDIEAKSETTFFLQGVKEKGGHNVNLAVDNPEPPPYQPSTGLSTPLFFDTQLFRSSLQQRAWMQEMAEILRLGKAKVLNEVLVTARREKEPDTRKVMYQGTNATTVVVSPQTCATAISVLQLLQGRVAGLEISDNGAGGFTASVRGPHSLVQRNPNTVVILVDGIVMDIQFIGAISPCNVESIDVITHPVSILNAMGVISILTKGGSNGLRDWSVVPSAPGTLVTKFHGYDTPKEFYSPKYLSTDSPSPQHPPDYRSTLFWNPVIKTDLDGNARVVFWNSDKQTSIRVTLEGMSNDGEPGFATFNYIVK